MFTELTDDQREALRRIVGDWIGEGFTTPPYRPEYYDIFEGLGLVDDDVYGWSIKRPVEVETSG